jgi:hypothetical protein
VTNSHLILCECNECEKGKSMSLSQWEKHVGSKMKKWKQSVRVSGSNQYLIDWLNKAYEAGVRGLGFFNPEGQTPFSNRERELIGWLLEPYEPIKETWIAERCAICRELKIGIIIKSSSAMDAILEFMKIVMVQVNHWTTGFAQLARVQRQRLLHNAAVSAL